VIAEGGGRVSIRQVEGWGWCTAGEKKVADVEEFGRSEVQLIITVNFIYTMFRNYAVLRSQAIARFCFCLDQQHYGTLAKLLGPCNTEVLFSLKGRGN
jgi:hypothetical protein